MDKKALLITESSIYSGPDGRVISRGGGEMCFHNIGKSLLKIGVEPMVFSIKEYGDQKDREIIDGVLYERFPVYSRTSPKMLKYLRAAYLRGRGFDFVFLNQFTPHLILPFLKGQKKIVIVHDVYKGEEGPFWTKQYGLLNGLLGSFIEGLQLRFDRKHADKIMAVSEGGKGKIVSALGNDVVDKIVVNPFPVNLTDYKSDVLKENFMLFIGRFVDYKHPEHVLYALKEVKRAVPSFGAVFVAPRIEGKAIKKFKKVQSELGLQDSDIVLKQNASTEEVRDLLARAKFLVQPSFVEGQGIVILEALASRTPVVAYDLPAYSGMLVSGENSLLVPRGDVDIFVRSCVEMLNNYPRYQSGCFSTLDKFSEESFEDNMRKICFISDCLPDA